VKLSTYITVDSAPSRSVLGGHITIRHNGKTVLDQALPAQTLPDPPAGEYRSTVALKFSGPGTYVATVDITVNGQSQEGTSAILVTKKHL
jgi:hypothetical protein